jgi:hypothetical protein
MVEQLGNVRAAAHALRLEHLIVVRAEVTALCIACRQEGEVDLYQLLSKFGRAERLTDIESHMRCLQCRIKGFSRLRVRWV